MTKVYDKIRSAQKSLIIWLPGKTQLIYANIIRSEEMYGPLLDYDAYLKKKQYPPDWLRKCDLTDF